jgi:uncharacterized protein YtpQ (UPF0354 family)
VLLKENFRFDQVFFEILKMKIRSISISHSITKTREEKDLTLKLEKDILNLEDIMNSAILEMLYYLHTSIFVLL